MSISLTIPNLDDETFRRLQAEAQRTGSNPESVAQKVLSDNLPSLPTAGPVGGKYRDLSAIAGSWTDEEYRQFLEAVADCRCIDPEIWK